MEKAFQKRLSLFGIPLKETPPQTLDSGDENESDSSEEEEKKTIERIMDHEKYLNQEYDYKKDKDTLEII